MGVEGPLGHCEVVVDRHVLEEVEVDPGPLGAGKHGHEEVSALQHLGNAVAGELVGAEGLAEGPNLGGQHLVQLLLHGAHGHLAALLQHLGPGD